MDREQQKEIRDVLLGRTVLAEDGRITSLEPGFHLSAGIGDGAGAVRFLGVMHRSRAFESRLGEVRTLQAAQTAMRNIGRGLILRLQPMTVACLIRYFTTPPVVLAFRYVEGTPVLTAFAGRGIGGRLSVKRAIRVFADEIGEDVKIAEISAPNDIEDKSARRRAKKAAKRAKKASQGDTGGGGTEQYSGAVPEEAPEQTQQTPNTEQEGQNYES